MKKETHITEFEAKRGSGLHIRVTTTRKGRRIAIDGGRLYFSDFATKTACMKEAKKIRDDILLDLQIAPEPDAPNFGELFKNSFDMMPLSHTSRHQMELTYKREFAVFDKTPITQVTLQDLQVAVTRCSNKRTHNSVARMMTVMRRIYKTAFLMQIPVVDYSAMIIVPKSRTAPKQYAKDLTYDQFMAALNQLQKSESYYAKIAIPIAWIMYYTGMRTQEVLGLQESDIDLNRSIIHVRRACGSDRSKTAAVVPLKTAKSLRDIPIASGLLPVLLDVLDHSEHELLFCYPDGSPIPSVVLTQFVNQCCSKHGISFSLYRLRHLFSADLFRQGTNPKVIQMLMGHANAEMSAYYAFTSEQERAEAIAKRKPS